MARWESVVARVAACGAAFAVFAAVAACGDADGAGADAVADVSSDAGDTGDGDGSDVGDLTGRSIYSLRLTLPDGKIFDVHNRELTGLETWYSFGSAHIGPAVAFTVSDSIFSPSTATITLDFGKIIGSDMHAVETPGVGTYPLDESPPAIEIVVAFQTYKSRQDGSSGEIIVTEWGSETGEVMAGTVKGTIAATAAGQLPIDVDGWFHFTLPKKGDSNP